MKFSHKFNVTLSPQDDWFDPILTLDTRLFLDPFLLYANETGVFQGSHDEVIAFFNSMFKLVANARGNPTSVLYRKALSALIFPEAQELCLGYTNSGTRGSGSGSRFASIMAGALWEAVQAGIVEFTHFEEVGILREGIGADRISDITATLLKKKLAGYTAEVCQRHNIPARVVAYSRGYYDLTYERWMPMEVRLPINPYNGKPILLVPKRYLRDLPTINADGFWDYCYSFEHETIRNEFNYDITNHVAKKDIIELARKHPNFRQDYLAYVERQPQTSYSFSRDEKGLVQWYDATLEYCTKHPLAPQTDVEMPGGLNQFMTVVETMVEAYRHFVEENAGWRLLWNDNGRHRSEDAAQNLFLGIVKHYCKAHNIDVSREPDIGRGPVDFKVSHGYQLRVLLELKLASNTKFWNGLRSQLPTYQNAEQIRCGYFIVIVHTEKDINRIRDIRDVVSQVNLQTGYDIKPIIVDARPGKPSASKL